MLEALLFASGEPLPKKRLAALIGVPADMLQKAIDTLQEDLKDRGLAIVETGEDVELRTSPEAAPLIKKLRENELSRDLGKAGLETLALVLYKKSATRSEIDFVRGVNSTAALRSLLLRGLIERTEDDTDRRRAKYRATTDALAHLGVSKVEDLPRYSQFTGALKAHETAVAAAVPEDHDG